MIFSIILVIICFSILIFIHELGHFLAARRFKIKVKEFGIGFPPAIFKFKTAKTIYSLNLFPIGGFVLLKGEEGSLETSRSAKASDDSFSSQSALTKIKVLLAGVAANLFLAFILFSYLSATGLPQLVKDLATNPFFQPLPAGEGGLMIINVSRNSPAEKAGLKIGEKIVSSNNQKLTSPEELRDFSQKNAGQKVNYQIISPFNSKVRQIEIELNQKPQDGQGYLGVATSYEQPVRYKWWQSLPVGLIMTFKLAFITLYALGSMVVKLIGLGKLSPEVTGPIGVTVILTQMQKFGPAYLIAVLAAISLSLGVINALPIPALDGGRALIVWLNKLGIKINAKLEKWLHLSGFALLVILLVIISIRDILRLKS